MSQIDILVQALLNSKKEGLKNEVQIALWYELIEQLQSSDQHLTEQIAKELHEIWRWRMFSQSCSNADRMAYLDISLQIGYIQGDTKQTWNAKMYISIQYMNQGEFKKALQVINELMTKNEFPQCFCNLQTIYERIHYRIIEAQIHGYIGCDEFDDYSDENIKLFSDAYHVLLKTNSEKHIIHCLKSLARQYMHLRMYKECIEVLMALGQFYVNDPKYGSDIMTNMLMIEGMRKMQKIDVN